MSILKTIKNFFVLDEDEDYEDDYYEEDEAVDEEEAKPYFKRSPKVVPVSSASGSRIKIIKPKDFNDSLRVADEIKAHRLVIFDVGELSGDDARRVVDVIAGAAYGLDGNMRCVSGGIFVASPRNIDITGDNLQAHTKNSFNWNV